MSDSRITEVMVTLWNSVNTISSRLWSNTPYNFQTVSYCFLHALNIKVSLRGNLKKLSPKKLFISYCHSVIRHSCQQYRIISGRLANTEKEKATFNSLKAFAKLPSNHHNDNILLNSLTRLQSKGKLNSSYSNTNSMETKFSAFYAPLEKVQQNVSIPFSFRKRYCCDYQALLESIADYLIESEGFW